MLSKQRIHFIGIGGAGMSGIAKVLLELGYCISGSDLNESETTKRLQNMGATIYFGHHSENISSEIDAVVVSTAIPKYNAEVVKAQELGIRIVKRAEMLAVLMNRQKGIAVAGAHGKTTTSSMISLMLEKNGFDPTVVVGGEINDIGGNAKLGQGEYLVAEADESDGSFLCLSPFISVVTNIEDDHLDYYKTRENIEKAFQEFIAKTNSQGFSLLCLDDPILRRLTSFWKDKQKIITYGFSEDADFKARDLHLGGLTTGATIVRGNEVLGTLRLSVPGKHNLLNALAAVSVGISCGLSFTEIAQALKQFRGVQRRFQKIGDIQGALVFDDYAHHPTELKATLAAAKTLNPKRIIAVFQPHRYSRTYFLAHEFGSAFLDADFLIVNEIYAAGEKPIHGVNANLIVKEVRNQTQQHVEYIQEKDDIVKRLLEVIKPGDLVITLGAGNIWTIGFDLVKCQAVCSK